MQTEIMWTSHFANPVVIFLPFAFVNLIYGNDMNYEEHQIETVFP